VKIESVLLIHPFPYDKHIGKRYTNRIPLGLCYIGEVLRQQNSVAVRLLDLSTKEPSFDLAAYLRMVNPDLIGFSVHSTSTAPLAFELARLAKQELPNCVLLAGGAHPSALPIDTLKYSEFDIVVIGEGELTMSKLVQSLQRDTNLQDVEGIAFKRGAICVTGQGPKPNLDTLPFMPPTFLNLEDYNLDVPHMRPGKTLNLVTMRGCPYRCAFCSYKAISGNAPRFRSAKHVVAEMERAVRLFNISNFYFVDDDFVLSPRRVREICSLLGERSLDIQWRCQCRPDSFVRDAQMAHIMHEAGCIHVSFGIESGDQELLGKINKRLDLEAAKRAITKARNEGIHARAFLMVGLPFQNWESIEKTVGFLKAHPPNEISVEVFVPHPGSPIYQNLRKWGVHFVEADTSHHLHRLDWLDLASGETPFPVISTRWMSAKEIAEAKAFIEHCFEECKP